MSIASRITSIEGHIEDDYNALTRLGADLTNVDKNIENIASVVNDIYDKLPKVTGTGSNVSLTPTLKGGLGINPLGNAEQDSTTGKNLFVLPDSATKNGITITKNNDGTFNISGTATANTNFESQLPNVLSSGTYTLSKNNNSTDLKIYIQDYSDTAWISNLINVGNPTYPSQHTENISIQGTRTRTTIQVLSGVTINLQNVQIQLESGSSVTSFEPYTGGIPSPNPSYPQDVKVVTGDNQVVVSTGNLLDSKGGFEKGYISATGVFNEEDYTALFNQYIPVEENQVLTLSSKLNLRSCAFIFYNSEKTFISRSANSNITTFTVTTPLNTKYVKIQASHQTQTITQEIINTLELQVEYGSSASSYKEYKGIQSTTLHLGTTELCKIGDYQDVILGSKDNWKVVRKVGKQNASNIQATSTTNLFIDLTFNNKYLIQNGLSNAFKNIVNDNIINNERADSLLNNNEFTFRAGNSKDRLYIKTDKSLSDLQNLRPLIYYVKATPTEETITDTSLINELNGLQELLSYDGTTNITITSDSNNAQMLVLASALKGE